MFRENERKSALFGSAGMLVLIIACVATIGLYKLSVPAHVDADTTSISYDDYKTAFLKWQESEIYSYEITLQGGDDEITLRVAEAGTSVEVLQHLYMGEPIDESEMDEYSVELRSMTVEYMFDLVRNTLEVYERDYLTRSADETYSFLYDLDVRFDPGVGYPVYMGEQQRVTRSSGEITWREVSWLPIVVKNFKVLDDR
ncbi:MAG TPA: hypothetical protein VF952_07850 [Chloroflexia bacterium]